MPSFEVVKLIFFKLFYLFYMVFLPYWVLPFSFATILLAFVLNHFMVSLIFTGVLGVSHLSDFVEHPNPKNGNIEMSWASLQLKTSVDYNPSSRFFNWTLGGFNAHALHHLLPDICHVHYLKILPIFKETCRKHQLNYIEMSYIQAILSHFRFLRKMGTQKELNPVAYVS